MRKSLKKRDKERLNEREGMDRGEGSEIKELGRGKDGGRERRHEGGKVCGTVRKSREQKRERKKELSEPAKTENGKQTDNREREIRGTNLESEAVGERDKDTGEERTSEPHKRSYSKLVKPFAGPRWLAKRHTLARFTTGDAPVLHQERHSNKKIIITVNKDKHIITQTHLQI